MEIAVIGGGHGCYAAAADLAEQGHGVRLWRRDGAALRPLQEIGGIRLKDVRGERLVPLALIGTEIAEVLAGVELVLAPLPATAQADLAARMAPHLSDGQVVFIPPGTFGSLVMSRAVRAGGNPAGLAFAEAGTLPYLARKHGPETIAITARATRLPSGVLPADDSDRVFAVLQQAFPAVQRCRDALDAALMNAGPIIHPPLIVLNAAPLQHFERWDIHSEGTQPGVRAVHDALDAERIAVREALGYGPPHFPLADHYDPAREEWMYGNIAHERLQDSGDWRERIDLHTHRYMREDVAEGLVFLVSAAAYAGVPCPVATGLVSLCSAIVGEDLQAAGRSFERLGLDLLDPDGLRTLLRRGPEPA